MFGVPQFDKRHHPTQTNSQPEHYLSEGEKSRADKEKTGLQVTH